MALNLLRAVGALLLFVPRGRAAVPILLWTTLIAWLGSWTAKGVGDLGATAFLANLGHAGIYGLLGLWFALALPRTGGGQVGISPDGGAGGWPRVDRASASWVLSATALWGMADEMHQALGGRGRNFSLLDVITDLVGAACVLAVVAYLGRDEASDRGLLARLTLGTAACLAAGAVATWLPSLFPPLAWL